MKPNFESTAGVAWHSDDKSDTDWLTPPPRPTDTMLYGLTGDIARAGSDGREVNPVSVAAAAISWLSAMLGRELYIPIGDARHPVHLYTLHIGRTAAGAKGESLALLAKIESFLRDPLSTSTYPQSLLGQVHTGGLSSREGLTLFVHDGYTLGKDSEIPPIDDKRLWVFEPEFQNVLAQGKREGNTLSSALRDVWDGGDIKPATKSNRIWATRPHIGLHGCITPGELLQGLEANEITNGFANRFLMVWAERTCLVPVPPETPQETVAALADRVAMVIRWATGHYPSPSAMYSRPMRLSPAAESAWTEAYFHLKKRDQSSERITALLERRAPITRRLAALFAATDQQTLVEIHHLEAALAWADYHRASVEWIFGGDAKERQQSAETAARREKIRDFLKDRDWVLRSEITARCFSGRIAAKELDMALQGLLADRELEQRTEERGGSARNTKRFYRRWAQ